MLTKLTHVVRLIVGSVFLFSGFVKLIDPKGSAYKFEEYFGADVLNLEFLIPYALPFAIALIIIEITLGTMLLLGLRPRFTLWSLVVLTALFLFLTWYSAYFNKVTDCGCFGDAITLTPWETFYKNVILLVFIVFLLVRIYDIHALFGDLFAERVAGFFLVVFLLITLHVLRHLPIIDFRPYAIGKNIREGMLIPDDAPKAVFEDTWIYNVNGEEKEFTTEEKPWNIEGATFVDRITKTISEGYEPPIHDFTMELDGVDLTDELLQEEKLMLVVMYDLKKTKKKGLKRLKKVTDKAMQYGYKVYAFTAASPEEYLKIKDTYSLDFDMLFCDETTLKTIIRANPGIVILDKGTVKGKWNWRDFKKIKFR